MYMYVKFSLRDLIYSPYPSHPVSAYTYEVTIALGVCGGRVRT